MQTLDSLAEKKAREISRAGTDLGDPASEIRTKTIENPAVIIGREGHRLEISSLVYRTGHGGAGVPSFRSA